MTNIKELQEITKRNAIGIENLRKEAEKARKENEKSHKQMKKELWGIWQSQEEVWIDLFRRNMKKIMRKRWVKIENISTKFKNARKINWEIVEGEYDLMWINGKDIVVVEVKNKLKTDDIKKFVNKQLPRFKLLFPDFKNYNLYWWIWSLIVGKHQEEQAEKAWLFVFTKWNDWNATITNKENFKAKIF